MPRIKPTLSDILDTSADTANRHIYLFGPIDDEEAYGAVASLLTMGMESDDRITLLMYTGGGSIEAGYAIFDAIKMISAPVTCIVLGAAMSMGAIVLQAADQRIMAPHARMMIHTGSVDVHGALDSDKTIALGRELEDIRERFLDVLAERATLPRHKIKQLLLQETYFSAAEALEHGFIDGIAAAITKNKTLTKKSRGPK